MTQNDVDAFALPWMLTSLLLGSYPLKQPATSLETMAALRSSTTALLRRTSGNPASQASASQSSRCLSTLTHRSSSAAPRRIGPSPLVQQHVLNNSSVNTTRTLFTRRAPPSPIRNFLSGTLLIIGGVFFVAYYIDSRSAIHRWVAIPILKATLDPEAAQKLAIRMCASGLAPRDIVDDDQVLEAEVRTATCHPVPY